MPSSFHSALIFAVMGVSLSATAQPVSLPLRGLEPEHSATLSTREGGVLDEVSVKIGDEVKPGQLVMKLNHERELTSYLAAKLRAESRHGIEIAEGVLREKNANLSAVLAQARRRQVSDEAVEIAQGQAQVARGQLQAARLAMDLAKLDLNLAEQLLENRYVRSPLAGTVVAITKPQGSRVSPGDVVMTVSDLTSLTTSIPVTESSLRFLAVGSSVPVRVVGSESLRLATVAGASPIEGATDGAQSVRLVFENLQPTLPVADQSVEALLPEGVESAPTPQQPATSTGKKK